MVDLGGYLIILTSQNGKIKLYGSSADNADSLEVSDEILEVNGRTLKNATHSEVIQHFHQISLPSWADFQLMEQPMQETLQASIANPQHELSYVTRHCINSRTVCLRLRRSGNKMELDGPNAEQIQDAWVIAVERGARERLQRLTALRRIQPRDIQAILYQQISEGGVGASTSGAATDTDRTNSQITITLANKELGANKIPTKLSNGTIPKAIASNQDSKEIKNDNSKERKDVLEKQQSCPEEANLLQPLQSTRTGERRASSPFQNGRTEVLIGDTEGGPRSPRGSTSSATNDSNFLNLPEERDYPEPICRSRRRSGSGVADIHLQQAQLQENNNGSRETKEPKEVLGPDEMWAPAALGHHRELPVDVPDTLLQQAYPNKVKNYSPGYPKPGYPATAKRLRSERRPRSASDLDFSLNLKNKSGESAKEAGESDSLREPIKIELKIEGEEENEEKEKTSIVTTTTTTIKRKEEEEEEEAAAEEEEEEEEEVGQKESSVDAEEDYPFAKEDYPTMLKTCSDDSASPRSSSGRSDSTAPLDTSLVLQHPLPTGKNSPLYDARRIDLGSPCRPMVAEMKIAPLFARTRDTTSFDNPAYGLADLQDLQGLLMRSDEVSDLTRLIDEQDLIAGGKPREQSQVQPTTWTGKDSTIRLNGSKGKRTSKRQEDQPATRVVRPRRDLDAEELIKGEPTDDLIDVELTDLSSRPRAKKKKKQASSGYSTLRSDASCIDLDSESFLVEGNKSYREVAVDCPPDFVPVTKCHPVYPPPNKTPSNSKHNTLDNVGRSKGNRDKCIAKDLHAGRDDSGAQTSSRKASEINASEPTNNNRSSLRLLPPDSPRVTVIARTVEKKPDKVRPKVKSLLFDSFLFRHSKPLAASYCTTLPRCSPSNVPFNNRAVFSHQPSTFHPADTTIEGPVALVPSEESTGLSCPDAISSRSTDSLLRRSLEKDAKLSYENPCLDVYDELDCPIVNDSSSRKITCSNCHGDSGLPDEFHVVSSFVRETDQNARNSLVELTSSKLGPSIAHYSPKEDKVLIDDSAGLTARTSFESRSVVTCESSSTQNRTNSRLSLARKNLFSSNASLSLLRSVESSRIANDVRSRSHSNLSIPKVRLWLSDSHVYPKSRHLECPLEMTKHETPCTITQNDCDRPSTSNPLRSSSDSTKNSVYDSVHLYEDLDVPNKQTGLNGVKPAIPPRDQKRAPARPPKDNLRLTAQNNNVEQSDNANTEPTQQQLHSIRKYQEQLRKRKDEEEKQEELNRSLRGSRKLQALESHATNLSGQENPAYAQDELTHAARSKVISGQVTQEIEEPPRPLTYGEVVATLERLQLQLRNISGALGISGPGVEAELEAVRTLLVQRRFATALATHHALRTRLRSGKALKRHTDDASGAARDCVEILERWHSSVGGSGGGDTMSMVEELTGLLTSYEMEGLLLAHDSIVSHVDGLQRKQSPLTSSPNGPPSPSFGTRDSRIADNIKIIRIEKTNEPLGATVRNEGDAVIIGRVVRGGAADKSRLLHEGDEVLEVNGVEMRGKSVNEVCDILAGMQGSLTFLVLPAATNHKNNVTDRREDSNQIQHVRAHFDYDPEEDPYIPCRELGVSFQKGDVLHVISQEDPNWWQAYREGEEDQTLAGLIPSRAFQHQRESMKQTIAGDKSTVRGTKKSSTLLCARKNPKKKKRNKFGSNFNDDGYPLYATTAIDDYDSEEVLTYEEVALYYPRANHKRPIVLIGPPNIGRHELRQRLMQDSERFAAAIPHTSRPRKDSEVDGQDYHFISRSQFESDILCRKFVEHGEYERAYYGTSVEAIRSVVNSGKICVLNLHPQSLKILRSSDLKPYVVFVAPPSLEKLRQKRIKNNEGFKEEELKDIIEKAREMEDKYGHLFDMIIINNDTDRAYNQLLTEINSLEREPQWVPASWVQ